MEYKVKSSRTKKSNSSHSFAVDELSKFINSFSLNFLNLSIKERCINIFFILSIFKYIFFIFSYFNINFIFLYIKYKFIYLITYKINTILIIKIVQFIK